MVLVDDPPISIRRSIVARAQAIKRSSISQAARLRKHYNPSPTIYPKYKWAYEEPKAKGMGEWSRWGFGSSKLSAFLKWNHGPFVELLITNEYSHAVFISSSTMFI